jgi:aspartate-semialdehyde dehydrogenase
MKSKNHQKKYNVAVVGATGNVGAHMMQVLAARNFPVANVHALASSSSIGREVSFGEERIVKVEALENFDFSRSDLVLFSAQGALSAQFSPIAAKAGNVVIDNTSHFRMNIDVPLVVPEVNEDSIKNFTHRRIIANPNCVVVPVAVALKPLDDLYQVKRVVISSYQSVSGAGKAAMDELYEQTKGIYAYKKLEPSAINKRIAFNVIPQIGSFADNGFTDEENKVMQELQKILGKKIEISATCVRVPVFIGHSVSMNVEFNNNIELADVIAVLNKSTGIIVTDIKNKLAYTMPVDCAGTDAVFISRIRKDPNRNNSLSMWVVSDNLRKGAALNAVQIAEILINKYL